MFFLVKIFKLLFLLTKLIRLAKYLDVFKMLAPKVKTFINACDFDIEGTVIGTNIIKFTSGGLGSAKRMKFSTTTIPDLKEAYANLQPIDINNFYAGEVRHILDWLWGINLSRALSSALAGTRFSKAALHRYAKLGQYPVFVNEKEEFRKITKARIMVADIADERALVRHDPEKLRKLFARLLSCF